MLARLCPYRQRKRRLRRRLPAPNVRAGPPGRDGGGRAVGRVPRAAGDLAAAHRLSARHGGRRRHGNPRRAAARSGDRHCHFRRRARPDGGAGSASAVVGGGRTSRDVRDLPRACARWRAPARNRCRRLLRRFRGRNRIAAPHGHRLRPARALARGPCHRARCRRGDCARRARLPERNRMSALLRGLLLPLMLPAHALALLAFGLLIGQQRTSSRLLALATFVAGLAGGLAAIALAVGQTPAGDVLLAAACLAGLLVAIGRPPPALACVLLAAVAGMALGLDSPPEAISIAVATIMLIGTALGASLALAIVVAGASYVGAQKWAAPRIGMRVLGSWIAASALLVLALRFARGQLF